MNQAERNETGRIPGSGWSYTFSSTPGSKRTTIDSSGLSAEWVFFRPQFPTAGNSVDCVGFRAVELKKSL